MAPAHATVVSMKPEKPATSPEVPFSLVLVRPSGDVLLWAGRLTPYLTQTITRSALLAGRGSHVFVTLDHDAAEAEVASVSRRLAPLRGRGMRVTISRGAEATLERLRRRARPEWDPPRAA